MTLYSAFQFALDKTNSCLVHLPYEGGVYEQPMYEYLLWSIFLQQFVLFKIEKQKEEENKMKADTKKNHGGRWR